MKKLLMIASIIGALLFSQSACWAGGQKGSSPSYTSPCCSKSSSDVKVREHHRKDGTDVPSYHRTAPDNTQKNNFSGRGNTNPYTGKTGTKKITH